MLSSNDFSSSSYSPPGSILIIGAGVFGLSTAHALLSNPRYNNTSITILDAYVPPPQTSKVPHNKQDDNNGTDCTQDAAQAASTEPPKPNEPDGDESSKLSSNGKKDVNENDNDSSLPTLPTSSLDSSRIIRPDYPYPAYARLADSAMAHWRAGWPLTLMPSPFPSTSPSQSNPSLAPPRPYHPSGLLLTCTNEPPSPSPSNDPSTDPSSPPSFFNPSGPHYLTTSLQNVRAIEARTNAAQRSTELHSAAEVAAVLTGSTDSTAACGDWGYLNPNSGWADAEAAMEVLRAVVGKMGVARGRGEVAGGDKGKDRGKVRWVRAEVQRLGFERRPPARQSGDGIVAATAVSDQHTGEAQAAAPAGTREEEAEADSGWRVTGAFLTSGTFLAADITIVAAGAWSPSLLPRSLGLRVRAAGQVLAYVDISEEERRAGLGGRPVALDLGTGMFAIFPPGVAEVGFGVEEGRGDVSGRPYHVKIARHGWGYAHSVSVPDSEPPADNEHADDGSSAVKHVGANENSVHQARDPPLIDVSIPAPTFSPIPPEGQSACRAFLRRAVPSLADRPFAATRLCWYADTGTGDFIVDWVPRYGRSVLVATGGSGHGFKFVPVIGELVVRRLEGRLEGALDGDGDEGGDGEELARLWRWKGSEEVRSEWEGGVGDGSRAGPKGMVWGVEMAKGKVNEA